MFGIIYNINMNTTYIVLICVGILVLFILFGLAIVNKSGEELWDKFNETAKYPSAITPLQFAEIISNTFFGGRINITFNPKPLTDSFSSDGRLTISSQYANEYHLAGLAIVAHELGHAFQFSREKEKMKKHAKKLRLSKLLSRFISPIFIAGVVLLCFNYYISAIVCGVVVVVLFVLACSVKLSTVKIENEASLIAVDILRDFASLDEKQLKIVKQFLNSARLTYIADLLKIMLKWTGLTRK